MKLLIKDAVAGLQSRGSRPFTLYKNCKNVMTASYYCINNVLAGIF